MRRTSRSAAARGERGARAPPGKQTAARSVTVPPQSPRADPPPAGPRFGKLGKGGSGGPSPEGTAMATVRPSASARRSASAPLAQGRQQAPGPAQVLGIGQSSD